MTVSNPIELGPNWDPISNSRLVTKCHFHAELQKQGSDCNLLTAIQNWNVFDEENELIATFFLSNSILVDFNPHKKKNPFSGQKNRVATKLSIFLVLLGSQSFPKTHSFLREKLTYKKIRQIYRSVVIPGI